MGDFIGYGDWYAEMTQRKRQLLEVVGWRTPPTRPPKAPDGFYWEGKLVTAKDGFHWLWRLMRLPDRKDD